MWLVTGNGNPNYIFFQCLAYGLFVALILQDFVSATVKRDKVRRMVVKGDTKEKQSTIETEGEEKMKSKQKQSFFDEVNAKEASRCGKEVKDDTQENDNKPEPAVVFL